MVRSVLQESNEKLHGDLENTRFNADRKHRSTQELEDSNKRLTRELEEQKVFPQIFPTLKFFRATLMRDSSPCAKTWLQSETEELKQKRL
jgi:hypothetical protein